MIADAKIICRELSKKQDINLNLLLSINSVVFAEIFEWSQDPTYLKVYLKHFGSWFFKKKKTSDKYNMYKRILDSEEILLDTTREKIDKKLKNYTFISGEYKKYTKDRYEVKCEKYGKEAYEAYCLAAKQKKIQKTKSNKPI